MLLFMPTNILLLFYFAIIYLYIFLFISVEFAMFLLCTFIENVNTIKKILDDLYYQTFQFRIDLYSFLIR